MTDTYHPTATATTSVPKAEELLRLLPVLGHDPDKRSYYGRLLEFAGKDKAALAFGGPFVELLGSERYGQDLRLNLRLILSVFIQDDEVRGDALHIVKGSGLC